MTTKRKIIVLGGGISGLSAAYYLTQQLPNASIQLWEKEDHSGGVLSTAVRDGFHFERSADNFITTEPDAVELCKAIGLGDEIVTTSNRFRRTYVECKGSLYPLPDGFLMMAPTKLFPLALTPLLSPLGKIRAGLELFLPRKARSDESLAQFVIRRLGQEVYDRIVEPLVSGIYAGDAKQLSAWATLPRFPQMEEKYRSLILAMKRQQKYAKKVVREEESGARYSFFVALRCGLETLAHTLADHLPDGTILTGRRAVSLAKTTGANGSIQWVVTDQKGQRETFDAVVSALPAREIPAVFAECSPIIATCCQQIKYSSAAVIGVAYRTEQIDKPIQGMGFVVPELEKSPLIAGSFSSYKYPYRAPDGTTLIRLFAGGTRAPHLASLDESELMPMVLNELARLLKINGPPIATDLARWPDSMPQYNVGHLDLLHQIDNELVNNPSLAVAGNSWRGVGIPACIKSGRLAAERIVQYFSK